MQIADLKAKPTDLRLMMQVKGQRVVGRNIFLSEKLDDGQRFGQDLL
jgi:hypothetical protein